MEIYTSWKKLLLSTCKPTLLAAEIYTCKIIYSRFLGVVSYIQFSFFRNIFLFSPYRVLPPALDILVLPFCALSNNDFKFMSQCPQTNNVKLLNLSNNRMYLEDSEPIQELLEKVANTLRHLELDHCLQRDSTISILIPALRCCSQLSMLSFASNPITLHMLMRILQALTPLKELKSVIYPTPVPCNGRWHFWSTLDLQKLANIQAELKLMLDIAQRNGMKWITYS